VQADARDAGAAVRAGGVHRVQRRAQPVLHGGLPPEAVAVLPVQHRQRPAAQLSRCVPHPNII
jgi:hypothetical protein